MGKMANILIDERQQGSLPSNSEKNPRGDGREHVKAITLRSGRELATRGPPPIVREERTEIVEQFILEDQRPGEQPQEQRHHMGRNKLRIRQLQLSPMHQYHIPIG